VQRIAARPISKSRTNRLSLQMPMVFLGVRIPGVEMTAWRYDSEIGQVYFTFPIFAVLPALIPARQFQAIRKG
jgi:hypothetical protein